MTDHTHHMPPAGDIYPQDTTSLLEAAAPATVRPRDADVLPLCIGPSASRSLAIRSAPVPLKG